MLVARREYLRDHPDKVRAVVEAYSRAAHHYRSQTGGLAKLVKSDDPNLSDTEAKSLVAGIQWKNTLENYTHFGLVRGASAGDLLSLEDMIANVTDVLIKTGALESDPLGGRHSSLYFDQILTDMKADNFHPSNRMNLIEGLGQGRATCRACAPIPTSGHSAMTSGKRFSRSATSTCRRSVSGVARPPSRSPASMS